MESAEERSELGRSSPSDAKAERSFASNATLMVVGAIAAQAITLLVLPVLTRLYSPTAIALQATFLALSQPLMVIATMRLDLAVVLPRNDSRYKRLVVIIFYQSMAVCAVLAAVIATSGQMVSGVFTTPANESVAWLWLLLPMVAFSAMFQAGLAVANRTSRFQLIVFANLSGSLGFASAAILLGVLTVDPDGVVWARVGGQAIGIAVLLGAGALALGGFRSLLRPDTIKRDWRANRQFLAFNTPYSLVGGLTRDLPIFVFSAGLNPVAAASYALARTVTLAPISLMTTALSGVFYKEAVDYLGQPRLERLANKLTAWGLFGTLPGFAFLAIWGDQLFVIVFGAAWESAGRDAQLLAVPMWLALQGGWPQRMFEATARQGVSFSIQIAFDAVHVIVICTLFFTTGSATATVAGFAISYSLYHLAYLYGVYRVAKFESRWLTRILVLGFASFGLFALLMYLPRLLIGSQSISTMLSCGVTATVAMGLVATMGRRKLSPRNAP